MKYLEVVDRYSVLAIAQINKSINRPFSTCPPGKGGQLRISPPNWYLCSCGSVFVTPKFWYLCEVCCPLIISGVNVRGLGNANPLSSGLKFRKAPKLCLFCLADCSLELRPLTLITVKPSKLVLPIDSVFHVLIICLHSSQPND